MHSHSFDKISSRLNKEQRRAVEVIEGPVSVIAGPGTGKTEILAARITNILHSTNAKPENILCLTYTDAGTIAMRNRLLEFIGPDAYRVDVLTFHSFCSRVIQEQSEYFGLRGLMAASDLERYQIVRKIIDSFPLDHPLTRSTGDIYYEAKRLLELYGIMKQEGWTPAWLSERVDAWVQSMDADEEYLYKRAGKAKDGSPYKKGDVNEVKLQEAKKKAEQFRAAANTYGEYQRLLRERKRYDFADMILWVIDAFKRSAGLLSNYQDRYEYILVDEFQDTSGSQYELLMQLADYSDSPNLFTVGDDDQSIFRFQGASVENLRRFESCFGEYLTSVSLIDNHRSSQNILDAAASLINRNVERLSVDKKLVAVNSEVNALTDKVELRSYPTLAQEIAGVAGEIVSLKESGVPLSRIAVIYRNHRQSEDIIRFLTSKGIPVVTRKRADVLQEPLTHKLVEVLRYLAAELRRPHSGDTYLFKMLHEKWFNIQPISLARFSADMSRKAATTQQAVHWREELGMYTGLPIEECEALSLAGAAIDELVAAAATMPLRDLMHYVITRLGLLSQALTGDDQVWNLQVLNTLFDFVRDESVKSPLSLVGLLEMLDDMAAQGITLPAEKLSDTGDGVNFVTAHGAKGLEFDHVFMIGCTSNAWDGAPRSRTYCLPPTVWRSIAGSEEEESRRLFYVGMTRARKRLAVSWSIKDNNDKALERSRFVAELDEAGCPVVPFTVDGPELVDFGLATLQTPPNHAMVNIFNDAFVDSLLKNYSMSVSHLSAYLRCPTSFYFERLLRVPAPASIARSFGLAVHYALEFAFKAMVKRQPREFPPTEEFMEAYREYMQRHEADFASAEYRRRMEYAEAILPGFYERHVEGWNKNSLAEHSIRNVTIDGVPVTGKLDRIEFQAQDRHIETVDDKSGNFEYAKKKLRAPDPEKVAKAKADGKVAAPEYVVGGDYWRQAVFYQILAEADQGRGWVVDKTRFEFIEPDKETGEYRQEVVITDEADVVFVKQQIKDVYGKIQNKEFSQGCDDPECEWCNFVKQHAA